MADAESDIDDICPPTNFELFYNSTHPLTIKSTNQTADYKEFNPIGWTYIMSGIFTTFTGLSMICLDVFKVDKRIEKNKKTSVNEELSESSEEPFKDVVWFFLPVLAFFFIVTSLELLFQSYIYSISLCSNLGFTVSLPLSYFFKILICFVKTMLDFRIIMDEHNFLDWLYDRKRFRNYNFNIF